jgi:hypothetical protein
MSGVIFEGDTIKRFGERFPRPFIEEIIISPEAKMDVIVSVFFQVPASDDDVDQFKIDLGTSGLVISGCVIDQAEFDVVRESADETLLRNFYILDRSRTSSDGGLRRADSYPTDRRLDGSTLHGGGDSHKNIEEFSLVSDEIYNSKGDRFMKYTATYETMHRHYTGGTNALAPVMTKFVTFSSFSSDPLPNTDTDIIFYKTQTSALVYEDVFGDDGSLNTGLVETYEQQNGNFYYQTPLMSLNRSYHATDNFGHKNLIDAVNNINQKYSIEEADNISYVLSENSENPKLLIKLLRTINKFTNKSSVTPAGKLYGEISSYLVVADALIMNEEGLTKKLITNTKITDLRGSTDYLTVSENQRTSDLDINSRDSLFFTEPLTHRMLVPFSSLHFGSYAGARSTSVPLDEITEEHDYFVLETQAYFLFDYEKALNYTSKISEILNPLVLLQIYGTDSLANFYEIEEAVASVHYGASGAGTEYTFTPRQAPPGQFQQNRRPRSRRPAAQCESDDNSNRTILSKDGRFGRISTRAGGRVVVNFPDEPVKIYSKLQQRAFRARPSHPHYRVACYEMFNYESIENGVTDSEIQFKVKIKDTTMQFYETYVRQKIQDLLAEFERYFDYADQFCSYNETDGLFNDFFIKAVKQEFAEPYIWVEAPLYYLLFKNMIIAEGSSREQMLDIEAIKAAARPLSKNLSPEAGNIKYVRGFYEILNDLYNTWFAKGVGLDESNEIYYDGIGYEGYHLNNPETDNTFIMTPKSLDTDDIIDELEVIADDGRDRPRIESLIYDLSALDSAVRTGYEGTAYTGSNAAETAYNRYDRTWSEFPTQDFTQRDISTLVNAATMVRDAAEQRREDLLDVSGSSAGRKKLEDYVEAIDYAIQNIGEP